MSVGLEESIVNLLSGKAAVTALIGSPPSMRLYPNHAPQDSAFPYAVFFQAGGKPIQCFDGPHALNDFDMSLACIDVTANGAKALGRAMRDSLNGFRGNTGTGYLRVQGTFLDDANDTYVPPVHADDVGFHVVNLDLRFWFTQT